MAKPWVQKRKRLQGVAKAKWKKDVRWIGGILYFSKTLIPVPEVPHIPKAGRPVIGKDTSKNYKGA